MASASRASPRCQASCIRAHWRGATFAVTEMQPSPPLARKASVVMSSPESWQKSSPQAALVSSGRAMSQVASLTPAMFGSLASAAIVSTRHVDHGAAGDVVDQDRQVDGIVDRLVVGVEPGLGRLVVVGRHHQQRIGAGTLGVQAEIDRLGGGVRARAGDHRQPPGGRLDHQLDHPVMLGMAQRRRFAGGPDRHQPMRPLLDLPLN